MIKNYLTIAVRNMMKRKGFTFVNIAGLAISLTVVLIVGLFLRHHLTYDQSFDHADRIYRLENDYRSQAYAPFRFEQYYESDRSIQLKNKVFLESFSSIDKVSMILPSESDISQQREFMLREDGHDHIVKSVLFTSTPAEFTQMFLPGFLKGSSSGFENDFQRILLTRSLVKRFFGSDWYEMDLIGKPIELASDSFENNQFMVAGIIEDAPSSSHFSYDLIVSVPRIPSWAAYTYFQTSSSESPAYLTQLINSRYEEIEPNYLEDERYHGAYVQALTDIHLSDRPVLYELSEKIQPGVLILFALVALIILIISWANYTNLSIALYSRRQKEIGMRKVLGARGKDISLQLMTEIVIIAMMAFPISICIGYFVLPGFNKLMGIDIGNDVLWNPIVLLSVFGLALISGLISGLYPAIVFNRRGLLKLFQAKLNQRNGRYGLSLRQLLLGIQFVLLISMLSLTTFIYQQMQYISQKDLGFDSCGVLVIPTQGIEQHQRLKATLIQNPAINHVGTGQVPGVDQYNQTTYLLQGHDEVYDDAHVVYADMDAMKALGIDNQGLNQLESGQDQIHLINQAMANKLMNIYGLQKDELIGMTLVDEPEYTDPETGAVGIQRTIAGILPDIHFFSMRYEVNPMIFAVARNVGWAYNSIIELKTDDLLVETISQIEEAYYQSGNERPFTMEFLDENVANLYQSEKQTLMLITVLSLIAISLGFIGLMSLVSYLVFTRQKEIGIRKVFGASTSQILVLINKEFVVIVLIALLVATPIIYQLANSWLAHFAYRIQLNPLVFIGVGFISLVVVVILVSLQSRKSALSNPTTILSEE